MTKKMLVLALAMCYICCCKAQDTLPVKQKPDFYMGMQVNQLLKEIINFSSSNTTITNPYLLTFALSWPNSHWTANAGLGYHYENEIDQDNPGKLESKSTLVSYRAGVGRRHMLGKRFEMGYGLDLVGSSLVNKTFTIQVSRFGSFTDSTFATSDSKTTGLGTGLQFTLGYYITDRIIISTEATYYLISSTLKENTTFRNYQMDNFNPSNNTINFTTTNDEKDNKDITLTLPIVLFLAIKF